MRKGTPDKDDGKRRLVIGVDFDNTIADYDELMHAIALERGLITGGVAKNKKLIRDSIRALPGGESHWRGLQVTAYGPRMNEARLIAGVREFFLECRRRGIPVYIVSHKTEYANFGGATVNLREAARAWLEQQGFFQERAIGLSREHVFFDSTRAEKIERMKALGATHFIDDLEETFGEPAFPADVEKILFTAHGEPTTLSDAVSFPTWREIHDRVLGAVNLDVLGSLAASQVRTVSRVGRGGNSKVYKVVCADGRSYAAKFYFQRTMDGLDRLEVEYGSLEFLWRHGERSIPSPLAVDRKSQIALYEFIDGAPIDSSTATKEDLGQMVEFAGRLRNLSALPVSASLQRAAEACFSFDDLAASIRTRLKRLDAATGDAPSYFALQRLVADELRPAFESVLGAIRSSVGAAGMSAALAPSRRTLSPSDFGFHNALRRSDGSVLVLDLEYFGWDDPAKLIADFVLHPAMSLSAEARESFVARMLDLFSVDASLAERLALSYPLFAIKWCTILLNEFVPDFLERREFAVSGTLDREDIRLRQLDKAKSMLSAADRSPSVSLPSFDHVAYSARRTRNVR